MKYSISAISNSLTLRSPFLGLISFLKPLPSVTPPNGSYPLLKSKSLLKLVNIPWAVSGLR